MLKNSKLTKTTQCHIKWVTDLFIYKTVYSKISELQWPIRGEKNGFWCPLQKHLKEHLEWREAGEGVRRTLRHKTQHHQLLFNHLYQSSICQLLTQQRTWEKGTITHYRYNVRENIHRLCFCKATWTIKKNNFVSGGEQASPLFMKYRGFVPPGPEGTIKSKPRVQKITISYPGGRQPLQLVSCSVEMQFKNCKSTMFIINLNLTCL